mmetsp:Transcript_23541/g.76094  ORF Transcript_23541/g.76094 Transcript_23541/m.76094 type:complete len:243 (+) Transcript_23541:1146-1874(+)
MPKSGETTATVRAPDASSPGPHHWSGTSWWSGATSTPAASAAARRSAADMVPRQARRAGPACRITMSPNEVIASPSISASATQSNQPCAPSSHESICATLTVPAQALSGAGAGASKLVQPLASATGPSKPHASSAPPNAEPAGRRPIIIPCPTYDSDGRIVQCQRDKSGRHTQSKMRRLAVAGTRKASSEMRKEATKARRSERQRDRCSCSEPPATRGRPCEGGNAAPLAAPLSRALVRAIF